jgi:hypothetical protein
MYLLTKTFIQIFISTFLKISGGVLPCSPYGRVIPASYFLSFCFIHKDIANQNIKNKVVALCAKQA